jgi:hypothetical protein
MTRESWFDRLLRKTVWHPDAVPLEGWTYRSLARLWLPVYDALAVLAGLWAAIFSPPNSVSQFLSLIFTITALVCLVSVVIPALHIVEIIAKIVLIGLLAGAGAAIIAFNLHDNVDSWFVAFVILMGLPLPLFRLSVLGEEIKERRASVAHDEES